MQIKMLGLGCLLVVTGMAGCGGGSNGGTFMTSVPSGTKLTDLTPAQAMQLCTDLVGFEDKTVNTDLCKLSGLAAAETAAVAFTAAPTNAQLQAACTQAYNACLAADGGLTNTMSCDSTTFSGEPSTCQATVGDLQTCANDQQSAINQVYGALPSCGSLTTANLSTAIASLSPDAGLTEPASCTKFDSTCDTSSGSSSSGGSGSAHRAVMQRIQALQALKR